MSEFLFELVLKPVIAVVFYGVGYVIGFFPVMIGSLGSVEPGPIGHKGSKGMKTWRLTYEENGTRYLPAEAVALVGWLIVGAITGFVFLLTQYS